MIRLAIAGAAGRMGNRVLALATRDSRFDLVAALEATGHPQIGVDSGQVAGVAPNNLPIQDRIDAEPDVLIEFSFPAGTMQWLDHCQAKKGAMVIGTSGHTDEQLAAIESAAESIPVLKAANMSVGVNLMLRLAGQMAQTLGEDYDIEIVEAHHRFKVDAPSGTAIALRDAIADAVGRDTTSDVIYGRHGQTGRRPPKQIAVHALRIGDTVGEHEVHFGTLGETLVLRHIAHTRDTFANGALRAAAWLAEQPAGLYSMQDVLFGEAT